MRGVTGMAGARGLGIYHTHSRGPTGGRVRWRSSVAFIERIGEKGSWSWAKSVFCRSQPAKLKRADCVMREAPLFLLLCGVNRGMVDHASGFVWNDSLATRPSLRRRRPAGVLPDEPAFAKDRKKSTRRQSTLTPTPASSTTSHDNQDDESSSSNSTGERKIDSESNFWYSVIRKETWEEEENGHCPCVPSLDREGSLPLGAYVRGAPQPFACETKKMCRLQIAIGDETNGRHPKDGEDVDASEMVSSMQALIDDGFTSFQLKSTTSQSSWLSWAEENLYGRLIRETPASVLEQCHLTIPLQLPTARDDKGSGTTSPRAIRRTVLESLTRLGSDTVDNVQVNYVQKRDDTTSSRVRFYEILEWLDALQELQREGCVRSFSGRNFSPGLLRLCHEHSFPVVSNQVDANLLDPTALSNSELNLACSDLKMPLTVSGPLAGGWLTDRFALPPPQQRRQWSSEPPPLPPPWKFTQSERLHFERGLRDVWTAGHGIETGSDGTVWKAYHAKLLPVLQHVARKHGVSISTVVLRWTLQLDEVASAVVTTSLQREDSLSKRRQELRDVFRFELDDQDMKQMWDVSGQPSKPAPVDAEVDEEAFLQLKEEMKEKENGLYVPRKGLAGVKKATDLDLATLSKFRF